MPRRRSIGKLCSFLLAAMTTVLAVPCSAQSTTVVVKEGAPPTTVIVKDVPPPGPSAAECSARAERAAMDRTGVAGEPVRGGVGGAAVGVIVGDNRRSAGRGAAIGAANRNDAYRRAYDDCMRGH